MTLDFHPASELFPLMDKERLSELSADIVSNGLHEPILLHTDGSILDGRNRYRACLNAGVEPLFRKWDGKGSPAALVLSLNLHRRHLNESQRAMVAAKAKPMFEAEARERMLAGKADPSANVREGDKRSVSANLREQDSADEEGPVRANVPTQEAEESDNNLQPEPTPATPSAESRGKASEQAAKLVNVSPRLVEHASTVLKKGTPELVGQVERGEVKVSKAAKDLTEAQARKLAIETGKHVIAGDKFIAPMTKEQAQQNDRELSITTKYCDAIELLASGKLSAETLTQFAPRFHFRKVREQASLAQHFIGEFLRQEEARKSA